MLEYSLIDSDEAYSYSVNTDIGRLLKAFDILGYDQVIVIGAYRGYADWLVSTYNQKTKSDKGCLAKNVVCENI